MMVENTREMSLAAATQQPSFYGALSSNCHNQAAGAAGQATSPGLDLGLASAVLGGISSLHHELSRQESDTSAARKAAYKRAQSCPEPSRKAAGIPAPNANAGGPGPSSVYDYHITDHHLAERTQAIDFIITNPAHFRQLQSDMRKSAVITTTCCRVVVDLLLDEKIDRMRQVREETLGRYREEREAQRQYEIETGRYVPGQEQGQNKGKGWDIFAGLAGVFKQDTAAQQQSQQQSQQQEVKVSTYDDAGWKKRPHRQARHQQHQQPQPQPPRRTTSTPMEDKYVHNATLETKMPASALAAQNAQNALKTSSSSSKPTQGMQSSAKSMSTAASSSSSSSAGGGYYHRHHAHAGPKAPQRQNRKPSTKVARGA